jgi:DNA (cytosine-5)-methyltransferase 1
MVEYGITDIKMRMLKIPELLQIQGFPIDYKLIGTQTEQKKFIGNAVEVNQAKALVKTNYKSLQNHLSKTAVKHER